MFQTGLFIEHKGNRLHYAKAGNGNNKILLFHGFGQQYSIFADWLPSLSGQYTLYSFDLFFHGQSYWNSTDPLEKKDWAELMSIFFRKESVAGFEMVGFSMGGKFALATLELFPQQVRKIYLLAPDGINISFWYSLATYPLASRYFFKSMILHPSRLYVLTKVLRALRLVDKGLLRFAEHQMNTEEKRNRVYATWVTFRHLKSSKDRLIELIKHYGIEFHLIIGRHDRVISEKKIKAFSAKVQNGRFEVLDAGHNDLIRKSLPFIGK